METHHKAYAGPHISTCVMMTLQCTRSERRMRTMLKCSYLLKKVNHLMEKDIKERRRKHFLHLYHSLYHSSFVLGGLSHGHRPRQQRLEGITISKPCFLFLLTKAALFLLQTEAEFAEYLAGRN